MDSSDDSKSRPEADLHHSDSDKESSSTNSEEDIKIPWHFWLVVFLAGAYIAYRLVWILIQGIKSL